MPMGMAQHAANSFNVFRGDPEDLRTNGTVGFSVMEPVACDVGADDLPEVGKRYAVVLPPQESAVEYYLVSANAGGEERYGRWQLESGVAVTGRSPVVMPDCTAAIQNGAVYR